MEKFIKIKTSDHKIIYGTLNLAPKESDRLIIFVHGLMGYQNEHIYYNSAKHFPKRGFNTFRFDLYSEERRARNLKECTIGINADDLDTVVNYFRTKFKKIYLVGHSLGGATVMLADLKPIRSVVLWDSTYNLNDKLTRGLKYLPELDGLFLIGEQVLF